MLFPSSVFFRLFSIWQSVIDSNKTDRQTDRHQSFVAVIEALAHGTVIKMNYHLFCNKLIIFALICTFYFIINVCIFIILTDLDLHHIVNVLDGPCCSQRLWWNKTFKTRFIVKHDWELLCAVMWGLCAITKYRTELFVFIVTCCFDWFLWRESSMWSMRVSCCWDDAFHLVTAIAYKAVSNVAVNV